MIHVSGTNRQERVTRAMEHILIEYGSDSVVMSWDGAQASAPIRVDGVTTPYQTANAQHRTDRAVRLACCEAWSPVVDDDEDVDDDSEVVMWSDIAYRPIEKSDVKSWTNVASYVATFPHNTPSGEGACDVSVQIGCAFDHVWFLRTHDDVGGDDDCADTAYSTEEDAHAAAEDFATVRNEANEGENAADYLARRA